MSWISGTFSRVHNWQNDADASIGIVASRHDEEDDNLSTGINAALHKGGQNTPTADISWGGYKLTSLGASTTAAGAARLDQAQFQVSAYAVSTGSANTYAVSLSPAATSYTAGMMIRFRPSASCTGASTVNVNALGAKDIVLMSGQVLHRKALHSSQIAECVYDGTKFILLNPVRNFMGALVQGTAISVPTSTATAITFGTEAYDTEGFHDTSTNTSRLTIPDGMTYVRLTANAIFDANATGQRYVYLTKNGVAQNQGLTIPGMTGVGNYMQMQTPVMNMSAGDYCEIVAWQDSGSTLNIAVANFAIEAVF